MDKETKARELWDNYSFYEKYKKAVKFAERNNYEYPEECTEEVINREFKSAWDLFNLGCDLHELVNAEYITPDVGQGYEFMTRDQCEGWCNDMFDEMLKQDEPEDIFGWEWEEEEEDDDDDL